MKTVSSTHYRLRRVMALIFSVILISLINLSILTPPLQAGSDLQDLQWRQRNPYPLSNDLNGVCCGGDKWVAVGDGGTIITSTNGSTWTVADAYTDADLTAVAYYQQQFIAVGKNGLILVSSDGSSWAQRRSYTLQTFNTVVAGAQGVAAAGGYYLCRSDDAWSWQTKELGGFINTSAYGNELYVMAGNNGQICQSTDSKEWSNRQVSGAHGLLGAAYGDQGFLLTDSSGKYFTSTDGWEWMENINAPHDQLFQQAAFGNGCYVVSSMDMEYETFQLWYSTDLFTWKESNWNNKRERVASIAYGNGHFIAVGRGGLILSSPDGISWTEESQDLTDGEWLTDVVANGSHLVAIHSKGSLISSDGLGWTACNRENGSTTRLCY